MINHLRYYSKHLAIASFIATELHRFLNNISSLFSFLRAEYKSLCYISLNFEKKPTWIKLFLFISLSNIFLAFISFICISYYSGFSLKANILFNDLSTILLFSFIICSEVFSALSKIIFLNSSRLSPFLC